MNSIILSSIVLLGFSVHSEGTLWSLADSNGSSSDAFDFDYYGERYQFCQASFGSASTFYTGTKLVNEAECRFPIKSSGSVNGSTTFKLLTLLGQEETSWKYGTRNEVPDNAIPCEDQDIENCFLGVSVYSDGICREAPGKISASHNMIYMQVKGKFYRCPFYFYLTTTMNP
ncbi:uncharacterized protein LOC131876934 [Tigriopus californicus]|uniref:uncharacterized protein LOC131876934 n=1 Tax=Tigriopus californicus TaxID=6832 RepID=UPI0027D9DB5F|nr:uncharacterized protein LOC131876934 [Tigriopus californicus]